MASSSSDSLSATPPGFPSGAVFAGWDWRGLGASGLPVHQIPEFLLKLVRSVEITANLRRCKKYFEKFCEGGQGERLNDRGHRGTQRNAYLLQTVWPALSVSRIHRLWDPIQYFRGDA